MVSGARPGWALWDLVALTVFAWATAAVCGESPETKSAHPAPSPDPAAATAAPGDTLVVDQGRLAGRFRQLEQVLMRLAELSADRDPRRAALLRKAIEQSRERDLPVRFETIVRLLEAGRLATADKEQAELTQELASLLQLLRNESQADHLEAENRRIRRYLDQLGRLIRGQRDVRARTERDGNVEPLAQEQGALAEKTGSLAGGIMEDAGQRGRQQDRQAEPRGPGQASQQPGDPDNHPNKGGEDRSQAARGNRGQDPDASTDDSDPAPGDVPNTDGIGSAGKRVGAAGERMQRAQKELEEARRSEAAEQQQSALDELQQAKAVLERILRQLREEEIQHLLVRLEARFRKMLEQQLEVYEGTKRLDKTPRDRRDHDDAIEAGRLSRKQSLIENEAEKALVLLREEGSSVAFPEAVRQVREDMRDVAARLQQMEIGSITQDIEQEIIRALEEMVLALEKARRDLENGQSRPDRPLPPGQPSEPPLVDVLAELKMIRALQVRVNRQTARYREWFDGAAAARPELRAALQRLSQRQEQIHRATRDLQLGQNRP